MGKRQHTTNAEIEISNILYTLKNKNCLPGSFSGFSQSGFFFRFSPIVRMQAPKIPKYEF